MEQQKDDAGSFPMALMWGIVAATIARGDPFTLIGIAVAYAWYGIVSRAADRK